jgi:hypothetical protein
LHLTCSSLLLADFFEALLENVVKVLVLDSFWIVQPRFHNFLQLQLRESVSFVLQNRDSDLVLFFISQLVQELHLQLAEELVGVERRYPAV